MVLFSSLLVAAAIDASSTAEVPVCRWTLGLAGLAVLAALPWPSVVTARVQQPPGQASGRTLPPSQADRRVLPWPSSLDATAMRWQAVNGMHFKMLGAYGVLAGKNGHGVYGTPRPPGTRWPTA